MVDYSKWDKLELDDSDSESDLGDSYGNPSGPRVTRLETPSAVTFGGSSAEPTLRVQASETNAAPLEHHSGDANERTLLTSNAVSKPTQGALVSSKMSAAKLVDTSVDKFVKNGRQEEKFAWSQSEREVVVHVFVAKSAKAKDIKVKLLPSGELIVKFGSCEILHRKLAEDVWGAVVRHKAGQIPASRRQSEANEEDNEMEWELQDLPSTLQPSADETRCVSITLTKYILSDMLRTVWWRRVFEDGAENDVDVTGLQSANHGGAAFQQAWAEAQAAFREKIRTQQQQQQ